MDICDRWAVDQSGGELAVKQKKRDFEIFSLSFLDVISCGFGAIVLLVLLSKQLPEPAPIDTSETKAMLSQVLAAETRVDDLSRALADANSDRQSKAILLEKLKSQATASGADLASAESQLQRLKDNLEGLALVQSSLKRASIRPATATIRDEEVGGIPVDSDYVVFIVDTSGSMQDIWSRVVREVENIINIHPKIKGFQILNDNGQHILSAYQGKWIPDTPGRRKSVIRLFKSWQIVSNSSPVEGLEVALKRYAKSDKKVSIYIFGDDYSGSSYDPVINALVNLNTNRINGKKIARVHAVGFISNANNNRFSTLMREVTRRNGGTFIALPR